MATTMDANEIVLLDRCPGALWSGPLPPANSAGQKFTNSSHHNSSATGVYDPGTKISIYDHTSAGWSTLAYLQYLASSGPLATATGQLCAPIVGHASSGLSIVTNDEDTTSYSTCMEAYIAVMLTAMTSTYWGWFWVGGVAPYEHCSALAASSASIATDDSITLGSGITLIDGTGNLELKIHAEASAGCCHGWAQAAD